MPLQSDFLINTTDILATVDFLDSYEVHFGAEFSTDEIREVLKY